ncbi:MAG: amidohydrolase family protein [Planctomycetota bacterium]|nr:amidohydrolase family protein [Planctomycetota bacterium]
MLDLRSISMLLVLAAVATAQDLTPKAKPQTQSIAIIHTTIHPVSSQTIADGYVLFEKGKIIEIGQGRKQWQEGVRLVDGEKMHVYPGFISSYTQLGLTEIGAVRASRDFNEVGAITPEVRAAVAVNPDSTLLPVTRSNGILTFASFPRGGTIPGRASLMRMDGWTWEDMAIRADAGMVVNWPAARPPRRRRPRRAAAAETNRDKTIQRIKDAFEKARAYLKWRGDDATRPVDLRWEGFRKVFTRERPVYFIANSYEQITEALVFAGEHKVRAVIVGGHDAPLCAAMLRNMNAGVIVENIHRFPKRSDSDFDEVYKLPLRLENAGVTWCLASGDRTANERNLPYAAARAVAYGLSRDAAIRAITLNAARVFGVDKELGSIDKGKRATLIVTDGDPLEVPTHVRHAFIDGREIDLSNKQTVLYEKYKAKYGKN